MWSAICITESSQYRRRNQYDNESLSKSILKQPLENNIWKKRADDKVNKLLDKIFHLYIISKK